MQARSTTRQLLQYGVLAAPVAFAGFPLYVLAPDFYATHHGVSLSVLAIILLFLRAFDAVQDPLIGTMSDRHMTAVPFAMLLSAVLLVASIFALFNPSGNNPVWWFSISMLVAVTAYSILSINLSVLGMLWTNDANEQTRIAGVREGLGLFGLLLAVSMPSLLARLVSPDRLYIWFCAILAALMTLAFVAFSRWLARIKPARRALQAQISIRATLLALPVATRSLYLVYGLSVLASSIPAVLVIFFVRDRLNAQAYTGLFLLAYFLSGALAMPLWKHLSVKFGKHTAWLIATGLAIASFMWAYFLTAGDVWQYALICIASGIALGGDLSLPPSILADQIHDHKSEASAATQFSILALLAKAGLAIGSAITLPLLDLVGFVPASVNTTHALGYLSAAYALIPCLIKCGSACLLYLLFIRPRGKQNHANFLDDSGTIRSGDYGV